MRKLLSVQNLYPNVVAAVATGFHSCCCYNFIFAPLLLVLLSMFVVLPWWNICVNSDRVRGVLPCDKSPKVSPYGKGDAVGIMKMFCGQFVAMPTGNQNCTYKFMPLRTYVLQINVH